MNVAIIGSRVDQSKDKVPFWKSGWELWCCNALYGAEESVRYFVDSKKGYPYHRWFELHTRQWLTKHYGKRGLLRHVRALDAMGIPVYVWDPAVWPEIKHARAYPKASVEALVPHGRYHAGSFDWILAMAITIGQADAGIERVLRDEATLISELHLYGVDLGPLDGEPVSARSCLEYWCGVAEAHDMPVVPHGGSLFKIFQLVRNEKQYGFEDVDNIVKVTPKRAKAVGVRL